MNRRDVEIKAFTAQERLLITSFRAMKDSAKHMMVDLAEDLAEALPATRPAITRQQFIADHQVRTANQQGAAS